MHNRSLCDYVSLRTHRVEMESIDDRYIQINNIKIITLLTNHDI